jgi:hypothetical protein
MKAASNEVEGECQGKPGGIAEKIKGVVNPDSTVVVEVYSTEMIINGDCWSIPSKIIGPIHPINFEYSAEGTTGHLRGVSWGDGLLYTAVVSGRKIAVTRYQYAFSPELQSASAQRPGYFAVGRFQVGAVSGLQLITETRASAQFVWTASVNKLGEIMGAQSQSNGAGTAEFAKKPDGTWFLSALGGMDAVCGTSGRCESHGT